MKRAHIFLEGRVQGVGFRHFTKTNAQKIGVGGWVKNLPDGRVEAVFEGAEEDVEQMVELVRQGPRSSRVADMDVEWTEPKGDFDGFRVRYY
ncbi:MAG: acylphosphatase [Balneolaceae bacterium]|nr:acylphosphatase [Balneolaceae bacterium]